MSFTVDNLLSPQAVSLLVDQDPANAVWVEQLPQKVTEALAVYSLVFDHVLTGGAQSCVFKAVDKNGAAVVVKLAPNIKGLMRQGGVLAAWENTLANTTGKVRFMDPDLGLVIFDFIEPGTPLYKQPLIQGHVQAPKAPALTREALFLAECAQDAARVAKLFSAIGHTAPLKDNTGLVDQLKNTAVARTSSIPALGDHVSPAVIEAAFAKGEAAGGVAVLAHGDLIPNNIIARGKTFVLIDPEGESLPLGFDIAALAVSRYMLTVQNLSPQNVVQLVKAYVKATCALCNVGCAHGFCGVGGTDELYQQTLAWVPAAAIVRLSSSLAHGWYDDKGNQLLTQLASGKSF